MHLNLRLFVALVGLLVVIKDARGQVRSPITVTPAPTTGLSVRLPNLSQNVPVIRLESVNSSAVRVTLPKSALQPRIYTTPQVRVSLGRGKYEDIRPQHTEAVMRLRSNLPTIVIIPCRDSHASHPECQGENPDLHHHEEAYCDQDEHKLTPECKKDYNLNPLPILDLRPSRPIR